MGWRIVIQPAAREEMFEAQAWYESRAPGLGRSFRSALDEQMQSLAEEPLRFPLVLQDVRRVRLHRFAYALFFRVAVDQVSVLACFHARRDPMVWQGRR